MIVLATIRNSIVPKVATILLKRSRQDEFAWTEVRIRTPSRSTEDLVPGTHDTDIKFRLHDTFFFHLLTVCVFFAQLPPPSLLMQQYFRSWWRGEGGFIPATTGDSPTSTNADDNSNKSKLEHLPLIQETKGLSWYGSISLTPSVTSASSSSTSSSHDPNQVATNLAVANPNKNQQNIKGQLPLSYIGSTMSSMEEARQPLLGMPIDDSHPIDPLQSNHHNHNTHDSNNNNTRSDNKKQGPPSLCWGAVANLCAATLGAGLLALPFAFAKAGWIGGLVLLTASAMATQYSITMIVMAAGAAKVAAVKARAAGETISYRSDSYESLVEFLLGKPWRRLVEVCLVVFCFGCIIGYTITVGDLLEAAHLRNGDYRVASMVTVWCVAMFPLSLLRSMQSLQWASAVGIASIGTLVLATLVNLIEDVTSDPDHGSNQTHTNTTVIFATSMMWKLSKSGHGPKVDVAANFLQCLWPRDWTSFVRALPLILFAFSCQVNVCAIYDELPTQNESNDDNNNLDAPATTAGKDPNEYFEGNQTTNRERTVGTANNNGIIDEASSHHFLSQKVQEQQVAMFRRVSAAAVAICASLYASIAIIGLANFGRHVFPNILSNYQVPINAMMQAAFAATALAGKNSICEIAHYHAI